MAHKLAYLAITVGLVSAGVSLASPAAFGQSPGPCCPVVAEMYPSPRPTPPLVGWTYITYAPLAPHEFLYTHHDHYKQRTCDGAVTRTRVSYSHTPAWPPTVLRPVAGLRTPPAAPGCPSE